jgi:hypothetical protein
MHLLLVCTVFEFYIIKRLGRKKFVLFPGDIVPPGVQQHSSDDFEPPHIVIQWFVEHYSQLKKGDFINDLL